MLIYNWSNNSKRKTLKGRECKVLARGTKNSIQIEFLDNGQREITSKFAVKEIEKSNQINLFE